jgi:hypothetical protein
MQWFIEGVLGFWVCKKMDWGRTVPSICGWESLYCVNWRLVAALILPASGRDRENYGATWNWRVRNLKNFLDTEGIQVLLHLWDVSYQCLWRMHMIGLVMLLEVGYWSSPKMMVRIIKAPRQNIIYGVVAKQFELVVTIGTVVGNPLCVCTVCESSLTKDGRIMCCPFLFSVAILFR